MGMDPNRAQSYLNVAAIMEKDRNLAGAEKNYQKAVSLIESLFRQSWRSGLSISANRAGSMLPDNINRQLPLIRKIPCRARASPGCT